MDSYITLKELGEYYFEDRKSQFFGFAKPVKAEQEALDFIQNIKKKISRCKALGVCLCFERKLHNAFYRRQRAAGNSGNARS